MEPKTTKKPSRKLVVFKRELPFYLMLIPGVTFLIIFSYLPMFGLVMAFQDFTPLRSFKNSPWVGLKNFHDMLALPTFWNVVGNTLSISIAKIILRLLVPLILALLLNEVVHHKFMRMAQTVFFLPYFLSWAVMGGVLRNLFQYDGMANELLGRIGIDPIMFLGSNTWFPIIIILSDVWKDMGYNMIIFLAAITGVDPALNESAALDGANRWQQIWHITLPTIRPIVVMLLVLSLGSVLSAGMEQIMLLYNPMHYPPSEQAVADINPEITAAVANTWSDVIVGVKSAHYWAKHEDADHPIWASIDGAIKAASMSGKIVMVDSIPIVPERSYPDILARLRPGDVHTHVFAQQFPLMDEKGRMQPYMLAERERGVHFDVGHGSGSFWFRQAVGCFNQGFWPDTISTDLHHQNVTGPAIDLLYVASKFLAMGMPLQDVLYRVTRAPALSIHRPELGTLDVGACADIAVLRNREGKFGYMDCGGARLTGEGKLECVATLREGKVVFDPEARSMPDWQNAPAPYWTAPGTTRSWTLWK